MIISFGDFELIKEKQYKTSRIVSFKPASDYKMGSNWYGGNAKSVAKTEDNLLLIVDKDLNTIDVAVLEEDVKTLSPKYIDVLVKNNKIFPIKKNTRRVGEENGL